MRHLAGVIVLALSIQGCQSGFPAPHRAAGNKHDAFESIKNQPNIEQLLQKRNKLCLLPVTEQRARFQRLKEDNPTLSKLEKFERLLLVTCHPDLTPGLLREALGDLMADDSLADDELYLLQLIRDFVNSNRLLEAENQRLKDELEATIKGIKDIESDIDNINQNGDAP